MHLPQANLHPSSGAEATRRPASASSRLIDSTRHVVGIATAFALACVAILAAHSASAEQFGLSPVSAAPPFWLERLDRPPIAEERAPKLVAEYEPVSIDSLPVFGDAPLYGPAPPPGLTVVTKGKLGAGESLGKALAQHGISASVVNVIAREMRGLFDFRHSRPGDRYRLAQDADGNLVDFRYTNKPDSSFHLTWNGEGYVVNEEPSELRAETATIAGLIESSLYIAIKGLGEKSPLANSFADLFAWDIDFSRNVQPGDAFSILYERLHRINDDGEREYVRPGRILAAQYHGAVGDHSVVLFEEDGEDHYYRSDGRSIERAFLAAPLKFSRISSGFQKARAHPILKITRPHNGIDYAARTGTPIWSVAQGVVIFRGRAGASGNLIKVRHKNGYISYYAHLSKFATGLSVGDRVEQKEVIGYVGSTGLATGPHLCFRVQKNGVYVDPLAVASPPGRSVSETSWAAFRSRRDLLLGDLGGSTLAAAEEAL